MRILPLLLILGLLTGCDAISGLGTGDTSGQSTAPVQATSAQESKEHTFAGLKFKYNPASWRLLPSSSAEPVGMGLEFLVESGCRSMECPLMYIYTKNIPNWDRWFDAQGNYIADGPCRPGLVAGAVTRLPDGDVMVDGVKAEYYQAAACTTNGSPYPCWLIRERGLLVSGVPGKNGRFPDAEVKNLLRGAVWVK